MIGRFLNKLINDTHTRTSRYFNFGIQTLIVLSTLNFSVSTLPNLSEGVKTFTGYFEVFTVVVFSFEYIARIWAAEKKTNYIFSFFGVIDLLAIVPFYITTMGLNLAGIRIIRLLRLFRLLKIARYSRALYRIKEAFREIKIELIIFFFTAILMIYASAVGIYMFEHTAQPENFKSVFHSLWWAVATLTTVGYGDIFPVTIGGKIFTFFMLMIGLSIVATPTGLIASAFEGSMKDN